MTTPATIRTLAEYNASPRRRDWCNYTLETRYAVGRTGSTRRGRTGGHMHLLRIEVVVDVRDWKPGTIKVGDVFSIYGLCNGNGQRNGIAVDRLDTDAITCTKCRPCVEAR